MKHFRFRRWLGFAGFGAIALAVLHILLTGFFSTTSSTAMPTLDDPIQQVRTGAVVVQVVDGAGNPLPDVAVHLVQTRHAFPFGVSLRTQFFQEESEGGIGERDRQQALEIAARFFNATVPEDALKWYATEPIAGEVSYAESDRILNWSEQHHLPMRGHHLFWAVEEWNQDWLKELSPDALREAVRHRATEICDRYRGRIAEYDVLNEMLNGDFFQSRLGAAIVPEMFQWCHAADPAAILYTNEYNILNGEQLEQYVELVRSLLDQGIPLGGIGIQAHIRQPFSPEQMQQALDRLAVFHLPIKLTEVSVVADTDAEQAQVLTDLYRIAFAHPAVAGITLWGFWEGSNWEPRSALFQQDFQPRAAAIAYEDLVFHQWWTDASGQTNSQGEFTTRAFLGDYTLTLEKNGQTRTQPITIDSGDSTPQRIVAF